MKSKPILASLAVVLFAAGLHAQDASPLKTDKDKTSYALGVAVGKSFQAQGVEADPNLIAQGLKDAYTNGKLLISDEEFRSLMTAFQEAMNQKQAAESRPRRQQQKGRHCLPC